MSLLGKIAALVSGGGGEKKVCVVDGDRMVSGDRIGPGERFQALNKLSRYASREELLIYVVFGGRPLREASDGDEYNGVHVYFGESPADVKKRLFSLVGKAGSGKTVLASSDQALLDEAEQKGITTLRASTLRKAMEASPDGSSRGEGGERDRGGRDRDRGGRNRGRNRGGNRRNQPAPHNADSNQSDGSPSGDNAPRSAPASGDQDEQRPRNNPDPSVKSLIDLVE